MIWPCFGFDQLDVARLVAPRVVYASEYHVQNQLYGFHEILKAYAGLPTELPLPWAMEHAISFGAPVPDRPELSTSLPIILAVNEDQAAALRARTHARVEPIGAAYFYMRALAARESAPTEPPVRQGTIVFPDKSTTFQHTEYDRAGFAARLAALPDEFQPVFVSVFRGDHERGAHLPFVAAGLSVVTSGHSYDPLFLRRQYDTCANFRYACANDLSTSFCLSILAGCRFFHLPTGGLSVTRDGTTVAYARDPTLELPSKVRCIAAAPFPPRDDDAQLRLAEYHAGAGCVRPPEFFRELAGVGRRLLQATVPCVHGFGAGHRDHDRAPWLFHGLDHDGWAAREWGLTLPTDRGWHDVALSISVPDRASPGWVGRLEVEMCGERHALGLPSGRMLLVLPVNAGADEQRVRVRVSDEVPLSSEPRARSLWIAQIRGRLAGWRDRLRPRRIPRIERARPSDFPT